MSNTIKIKFWGSRGSTPCANAENMNFGGNTTCVQLFIPGSKELLILDCGTGFRNLGNKIQATDEAVKGKIFITHPHWDHLQGFPFFKPFYETKNQFRIYLPPQGLVSCEDILQDHMTSTFFPVSISTLNSAIGCEIFKPEKKEFDHFSVEYMWANHTIPTAIFKFVIGSTVIVFSPDNEIPIDDSDESNDFIKKFAAFIHGADVLIHDAQYNKDQYQARQGWGHSAWENITEIALREKVKQLYLTHHDPDSSDQYLAELDEKIKKGFPGFDTICLVKEGQEIHLPFEHFEDAVSR